MADPDAAFWPQLRAKLAGPGLGAVLLRGASGSAGINGLGGILALLAQLALARLLDVTQFGYYAYAFTWVLVVSQVCRLGFQNSLVRFAASYRTTEDWHYLRGLAWRSTQLTLAAGALGGLTLAAGAFVAGGALSGPLVTTFALAGGLVVPMALLGAIEGFLRGYRRPARALLPSRVLIPGATLGLVLLLACTGSLDTAPEAMAWTLVAAVFGVIVGLYWCVQALAPARGDDGPSYRTAYWLRCSLPVLAMTGMNMLMKHTDTLMLGALADTSDAGLYFPVARLSELALFGALSVNAILGPLISELHTRGEHQRLQRLLRWAVLGGVAVMAVAVAVLGLLGEWLLSLFGAAFVSAYPALLVLLVGHLCHTLCGPAAMVMTMTGHQDRAAVVLVTAALVNLALNAALIPSFGLTGAAAATAVSVLAWNVWMWAEVQQRHGLDVSILAWRKHVRSG